MAAVDYTLVDPRMVLEKIQSDVYNHFLVPVDKEDTTKIALQHEFKCKYCPKWIKTNTGKFLYVFLNDFFINW